MRFIDRISPDCNVRLTLIHNETQQIEKVVETHNIWTNLGREYLANRISPVSGFAPIPGSSPTELRAEDDAVIRFMGIGIGGSLQNVDIATLYPQLDAAYPGTNIQVDTGASGLAVTQLERPCLVDDRTGNEWLVDVGTPVVHTLATSTTFTRTFTTYDVNLGGTYPVVPVSEIGLYVSSENPNADPYASGGANRQTLIAYNTFVSLSMTTAFSLQVDWEIRF